MTQNIVPKQQMSSSGQEVEGFRLAKSISTLKPYRVCILPAKEETEGSNPPKLKEAAVKASQKKNAKVWWCQWVTGLMQLLKAKDLQLNIKSFSL